jgi:hypothetical protein
MKENYININGKIVKCKEFEEEEFNFIFNTNWKRTDITPIKEAFFEKIGLSEPKEVRACFISGTETKIDDYENNDSKIIGGICVLRYDKKDELKGVPINWNHLDILKEDNKIFLIPSEQKREDHWYKTIEEWKERVNKKPPHKEKIDDLK